MWRARVLASNIYNKRVETEPRFLKNLPDWVWLDKLGHSGWSRLAWIAIYIMIYVLFAPSAWWFLLLPIHILMMPVQGVIINWFAHKYGSKNFKLKNTATNLFKVDIFMMGEGYHNNHHKHPSNPNFGNKWFELDPAYPPILIMKWLGVVKMQVSPA